MSKRLNRAEAAAVCRFMRGRTAAVIGLLALTLAAVFGCSSARSNPVGPSAPYVPALLGRHSGLRLVIRPAALMHDPYWGPAMRRAVAKSSEDPHELSSDQVARLFEATELEVSAVVPEPRRILSSEPLPRGEIRYVYVIRGMRDFDPHALVSRSREALFAEPKSLASGVRELPPDPEFQRIKGAFGPLFVFPDGTWVGVDADSASAARRAYDSDATPPPASDLDDDALFAAFVDRELLQAAAKDSGSEDERWRKNLVGAGLVVHGGKHGAIEGVLDYASNADAEASARWVRAELERACKKSDLGCLALRSVLRDVNVSLDGHRLAARFYLSDAVLKSLSER